MDSLYCKNSIVTMWGAGDRVLFIYLKVRCKGTSARQRPELKVSHLVD